MDDAPITGIDQHRFLIVDDEEYSRSLMERILRALGVTKISLARDGGEALKILLEAPKPIDCVLTDINMSPVNGLELLKVIRVGYGDIDRGTPVILFTGLVDMELVPPAINLDVNGFLAKPVAKDLLNEAIKHAFEIEDFAQKSDVYRHVHIPATSDLEKIAFKLGLIPAPPKLTPSVAPPDDEQRKPAPEADANDIQEVVPTPRFAGYTLAKDIVSYDGVLLLAAGVSLTERMLRHIIDLQKIDHTLGHTVFVIKETP